MATQKGFSIVELMIALVLLGGIGLGIFKSVQMLRASSEASAALRDLLPQTEEARKRLTEDLQLAVPLSPKCRENDPIGQVSGDPNPAHCEDFLIRGGVNPLFGRGREDFRASDAANTLLSSSDPIPSANSSDSIRIVQFARMESRTGLGYEEDSRNQSCRISGISGRLIAIPDLRCGAGNPPCAPEDVPVCERFMPNELFVIAERQSSRDGRTEKIHAQTFQMAGSAEYRDDGAFPSLLPDSDSILTNSESLVFGSYGRAAEIYAIQIVEWTFDSNERALLRRVIRAGTSDEHPFSYGDWERVAEHVERFQVATRYSEVSGHRDFFRGRAQCSQNPEACDGAEDIQILSYRLLLKSGQPLRQEIKFIDPMTQDHFSDHFLRQYVVSELATRRAY